MLPFFVLCSLTLRSVAVQAKEFYRPEGGRPVFPLIATDGSDPRAAGAASASVGSSSSADVVQPVVSISGSGSSSSSSGSSAGRSFLGESTNFVSPKSGNEIKCSSNADCYPFREPDDWCPMPSGASYRDRGCWCDKAIGDCVIDRTFNGDRQWSWCTSKSFSKC